MPAALDDLPRRLGGWALNRSLAPTSVTGISMALGLCAAAWFSAGTRPDDIRGSLALSCGYLAARGARWLGPRTANGPAMIAGARATAGLGGAVAEYVVYAGLAVGGYEAHWGGMWQLACAVMIVLAVRAVVIACGGQDPADLAAGGPVSRAIHSFVSCPFGGRVAVVAITTPIWGPHATLMVLLEWAIIAIGFAVSAPGPYRTAGAGAMAAAEDAVSAEAVSAEAAVAAGAAAAAEAAVAADDPADLDLDPADLDLADSPDPVAGVQVESAVPVESAAPGESAAWVESAVWVESTVPMEPAVPKPAASAKPVSAKPMPAPSAGQAAAGRSADAGAPARPARWAEPPIWVPLDAVAGDEADQGLAGDDPGGADDDTGEITVIDVLGPAGPGDPGQPGEPGAARAADPATLATLMACRDDGTLAIWLGQLVRGGFVPLPPAIAGLAATILLAVMGMANLPGILLLTPLVVLLLAAPGSSHPHDRRLDWLTPAVLVTAQLLYVAAVGFAFRVPPPVTFGLCGLIALRHAELAYRGPFGPSLRSRERQDAWRVADTRLGWEGRMLVAGIGAMVGIALITYLALAAYLVVLICARVTRSYVAIQEGQLR